MTDILYRGKAINRDLNQSYRTTYQNGDWVYGLVSRLDKYYHNDEMTNEDGVSGIDIDRDTICMGAIICGVRYFEGDIVEAPVSLDRKDKAESEKRLEELKGE